MERKKNNDLYSFIVGIAFFVITLIVWVMPQKEYSASERRMLAKFPEISLEEVWNGSFMEKFESYSTDQFPFRDAFRSIKANVHYYVLGQKDNNGIYVADGHISKMDYPLSEDALSRSVSKFNAIYETYLAGTDVKVYGSWIPDKNYFLAEKNGYLSYDYEKIYDYMDKELAYMTQIDVRDLLEIDDYYTTDLHWRQECIEDVAKRLASEMGTPLTLAYEKKRLENPFYGVYYGQLALPVDGDTLYYLTTPMFENCVIINHESGKEIAMYDMDKADGRDPYEMYLSGSVSVITIENPNATTEKELVVFRDSFGSSLASLLVEGYSKITLLDIRYLNTSMIEQFVEFTNQDVLFLYSTGVLNNKTAFQAY